MKILLLLIKTSWRLFILATCGSVIAGLCSTQMIRLIHIGIQTELEDPNGYMVEFGIYVLMYGVFALLSAYAVSNMTQSAIHNLRIDLSRKILKANFQQMEHDRQKLLPVLTSDIYTFSYALERLPHIITGSATVIGCYAYLFYLSWELTLMILGVFGVIYPLMKVIMPLLTKYSTGAREMWNKIHERFEGLVFGLKELSLNKNLRKTYIEDLISPLSKAQNLYNVKESITTAVSSKVVDIILLTGISVLLFIIKATGLVEFSFFGEFLMVVLFTMPAVSSLSSFIPSITRTEVALAQIEGLGLELDEYSHKGQALLNNDDWQNSTPILELSGVSHEYYHQEEDRHFRLGPIDLSIKKNEVIFIVGGNGSGKTSFAKLMTGLYKAREGTIKFKGAKIDWDNLEDYRDQFAAIFTDFHLFDNIQHIQSDDLKQKVDELLKLLLLEEKLELQGHQLSTIKLSQGQRKRVGLMTAILEDKEIYLFDEWAANQDPSFKHIFYKKIIPELKEKGKTIVIISHDEEYFNCGDRVLHIQDGTLVERNKTEAN